MRRPLAATTLLVLTTASVALACTAIGPSPAPAGLERIDAPFGANFLTDSPAVPAEGWMNVVVEIPAGTLAKWETTKDGSALEWERLPDGQRRVVQYLPYPANYGMVPRTLLPREEGGDGDPLDVVVLGEAVPRARLVRVRPIGVLVLIDDGEIDDKLIAVPETGPFSVLRDVTELDQRFPASTTILATWFLNYKGAGRIEVKGLRDAAAARARLAEASTAFEARAKR